MSPDPNYAPTSPRESPMWMDAVSVFDGDIRPVLNLLEGSPLHQREVLEHNVEIPKLANGLGGVALLPLASPDRPGEPRA